MEGHTEHRWTLQGAHARTGTGSMPAHAGLDGSGDDRIGSVPARHRRDRQPGDRRRPDIVAEGPDLVVHATPAQLAEMDDFVTAMHTRSGLLDAITTSTLTLRGGRSPDPGVPQAAHSRGPHRPAGRELHRHRPALPGRPAARDRGVPPLSLRGRLDGQRALPALVPRRLKAAPDKKGGHRALQDIQESVAELAYYRDAIFIPPPAPTTPEP